MKSNNEQHFGYSGEYINLQQIQDQWSAVCFDGERDGKIGDTVEGRKKEEGKNERAYWSEWHQQCQVWIIHSGNYKDVVIESNHIKYNIEEKTYNYIIQNIVIKQFGDEIVHLRLWF